MRHLCLIAVLIGGFAFGCAGWADQARADEATGSPQIKAVQIGFGGTYKVGHWTPLWITIVGGGNDVRGRLEATAPDSDGVPVTYGDAGGHSVELPAGEEVSVPQYIKFGRTPTDLTVRLIDDGKEVAASTFSHSQISPLSSTQEMIVSVGRPIGIEEALRKRLRGKPKSISVCRLDDPERFPRHWFGYEGVDTVVATTSELCALERLGEQQIDAFERWIQLGGRLVLCVGERGEEVFGEGNLLARFAPGGKPQVLPLRSTSGLEDYAGATERLDIGRDGIKITAVTDVYGEVISSDIGPSGRLPTIIRFPYGLGKVVFVAFDPDKPPFVDWQGRTSLVAKILEEDGWGQRDGGNTGSRMGQVAHLGYEDLVGQLREALDVFQGVTRVRFSWVAGLILLYILLIGPGDYFLLRKFGRLHWTWLSFPLIVLAFCVLAFLLANRLSGNRLRVNQVELVDVDIESSVLRGTMWAHIYSPDTQTFNLSLERSSPTGEAEFDKAGSLLTWQGLPGDGLGGMKATAAADVFTEPYRILYPTEPASAAGTPAISGLPILTSASKSLTGRWWDVVDADTDGRLTATSNGLLSGRVTYPLDVKLSDCMVLYENRAYLLSGALNPGESISFDRLKYRDLEWRLTRRRVIQTRDIGTPWDQTSLDVPRIMEIMMFHEAAGGESYTGLSQRFQPFVDLSDHLRTGRAILVGRSETPASQLARDGQSIADSYDLHWTCYRVVFPVEKL